MIINLEDNKKRAKLFLDNNVYTFINEYLPDKREFQYNGFIISIKSTGEIEFFDIVKKKIIYFLLDRCSLDYSNGKLISEKEALKLLKEFENGS